MGKYDDKKAKDIQKGFDKTTRSIIDGFNKSGMSGDAYAEKYKKVTAAQKEYFNTVSAGEATMEGLAKSMAKPTTTLGKISKTLVSAAGSVGVDLLLGAGIQLAANAWMDYANRQETALDEANTAIADHEKSASSLASATSMVESSGERFVELQKGINTATGENKSLTEAEYQEYTTMANSLAETLPGLSNGYNAIGNAKIKAVGSIEDLNAALREQQKVVNNETIQNAHKYAKAYDALTDHEAVTMVDEAGYKQQERALRNLKSAYEDGQ